MFCKILLEDIFSVVGTFETTYSTERKMVKALSNIGREIHLCIPNPQAPHVSPAYIGLAGCNNTGHGPPCLEKNFPACSKTSRLADILTIDDQHNEDTDSDSFERDWCSATYYWWPLAEKLQLMPIRITPNWLIPFRAWLGMGFNRTNQRTR